MSMTGLSTLLVDMVIVLKLARDEVADGDDAVSESLRR